MKRNLFGEIKIQPGEDLAAVWSEEYGVPVEEQEFDVLGIAEDENFGWGCTLQDSEGNEAEVHDFSSQESLLKYLLENGLEVE